MMSQQNALPILVVISQAELEEIALRYKQTAGFTVNEVNRKTVG